MRWVDAGNRRRISVGLAGVGDTAEHGVVAEPAGPEEGDVVEFGYSRWGRAIATGLLLTVVGLLGWSHVAAGGAGVSEESRWDGLLFAGAVGLGALLLLHVATGRVVADRYGVHVVHGTAIESCLWDQISGAHRTSEDNYPRVRIEGTTGDVIEVDDFLCPGGQRRRLENVVRDTVTGARPRPTGCAADFRTFPTWWVALGLAAAVAVGEVFF